MTKKVFLSPSNQPANKYVCSPMTEKRYCERVTDNIAKIWNQEYLHDLMLAPYDVAYNYRPAYAVKFGAKYYVCVHTNASGQAVGTARGAVVFYNNAESKVIAERIVKDLNAITPHTENRSNQVVFKTSGLAEISGPHKHNMNCVFIEIDFHDNPAVCAWLLEKQEEISRLLAVALAEGIGLEKKPEYVPAPKVMYRVKIDGVSIMSLSYYDNAVAHVKNLIDDERGKVGTVERNVDGVTLFTYSLPKITYIARGQVIASVLNVRDKNSTAGKVVTQLKKGTEVPLLEKVDGWYRIELPYDYPQKYGWVSGTYISVVAPVIERRYTTDNLNLRSKPNSSATILTTMPKNAEVFLVGYSNQWFEVNYKDFSGYCHGNWLAQKKPLPLVKIVNCSYLNMRKAPNGSVLKTLPVGTKLELLDSSRSDWWKIRHNGVEGFCGAKYLKRI